SARIASYELAYRMQANAPEAVDISKEPEHIKSLYGIDDAKTKDFGYRCLLARRMVERGVRYIQLYSGGGNTDFLSFWDAHGGLFQQLTPHEGRSGETNPGHYDDYQP